MVDFQSVIKMFKMGHIQFFRDTNPILAMVTYKVSLHQEILQYNCHIVSPLLLQVQLVMDRLPMPCLFFIA